LLKGKIRVKKTSECTKDKAETLAKKRLYIKENFLDPIN